MLCASETVATETRTNTYKIIQSYNNSLRAEGRLNQQTPGMAGTSVATMDE